MAEDAGEVVETGGDVLDAAGVAPVALGREVDDEARRPGAGVEDETAPGPDLAARAGVAVGLVVGREAMAELEGESPAHDADAVDGVDEGLAAGREEVASGETDHGRCSWLGEDRKEQAGPAHGAAGCGLPLRAGERPAIASLGLRRRQDVLRADGKKKGRPPKRPPQSGGRR